LNISEKNVTYEPESSAGGVPEMVREDGGEEEESEPQEVSRHHPPHQQQKEQQQRQGGAVQERSLGQGYGILFGEE
jgi:hypothetical protein